MENYIPLEYDRSHLQTRKVQPEGSLLYIDYYDVALIIINLVAIIAIVAYHFITPKKQNEEIVLKAWQKSSHDIPHFTYNRHGKKSKLKQLKQKEGRQLNPHSHFTSYNLVELKCLKCAHTTQVYEAKNPQI